MPRWPAAQLSAFLWDAQSSSGLNWWRDWWTNNVPTDARKTRAQTPACPLLEVQLHTFLKSLFYYMLITCVAFWAWSEVCSVARVTWLPRELRCIKNTYESFCRSRWEVHLRSAKLVFEVKLLCDWCIDNCRICATWIWSFLYTYGIKLINIETATTNDIYLFSVAVDLRVIFSDGIVRHLFQQFVPQVIWSL